MRKKKLLNSIIILILVFLLLFVCFRNNPRTKDFFLWCDGYVAAAQEEEIDVAFTFLSETKQLDERIQNITIPENQIVKLSDFKISKMDSRYKDYAFKGCYCGALDFSEDDIELSYQNLG